MRRRLAPTLGNTPGRRRDGPRGGRLGACVRRTARLAERDWHRTGDQGLGRDQLDAHARFEANRLKRLFGCKRTVSVDPRCESKEQDRGEK